MAKGGAFNVSQLIRELGLQTIEGDTMRVLETIQPTMIVADISDSTPPHVGASAMFGASIVGTVPNVGLFELQCLAPGGAFIEWMMFSVGAGNMRFRVTTVASGVSTLVAPAGVLSRDPIVSIARIGNVAPTGLPHILVTSATDFFHFGDKPFFIPRGAFFQLEAASQNVTNPVGCGWREIPASEHVPA